ncbi:hypothetical protein ABZ951_15135 [Streptomyces sp. NPDC046215]
MRCGGRDPLGLGAAIVVMMAERGMVAPAADGSVLAQFDTILATAVHELAGWVQAVKFDADTGRLDAVPDAPAVGTKLRWSAPKLIAAANETVPKANVRALHVLAPALMKDGPATAVADPAPQPAAPAAPVERRTPPDGYRRAIEAHPALGNAHHLGLDHPHDQAHHPPKLPQERTAGLPRGQAGLIHSALTVSSPTKRPPGPQPARRGQVSRDRRETRYRSIVLKDSVHSTSSAS